MPIVWVVIAMRWVVGGKAIGQAASTSQMGRLPTDENVEALVDERDKVHDRPKMIILDMDSSVRWPRGNRQWSLRLYLQRHTSTRRA